MCNFLGLCIQVIKDLCSPIIIIYLFSFYLFSVCVCVCVCVCVNFIIMYIHFLFFSKILLVLIRLIV